MFTGPSALKPNACYLVYYTPPLTPSRRPLMSWCATFTRGPHLASRIVTLSLTMPAQTSLHADDVSRRKHALHFCVNLRNLSKHVGRGTPLLRLCGAVSAALRGDVTKPDHAILAQPS